MPKRAQIAFAPVDKDGTIATRYIRSSYDVAYLAVSRDSPSFEADGWRIRRVRIELDEGEEG